MDRDLFITESGKAAFRISQVQSMRMKSRTHVILMKDGETHYISKDDVLRLQELQGMLPLFPHQWFSGDDCAFDTYYITAMRTVAKGVEIFFDTSSGMPGSVTLPEKEFSKLMAALNNGGSGANGRDPMSPIKV